MLQLWEIYLHYNRETTSLFYTVVYRASSNFTYLFHPFKVFLCLGIPLVYTADSIALFFHRKFTQLVCVINFV